MLKADKYKKYVVAVKRGKTKKQAALDAGFSPSTARVPTLIEKSAGCQEIMEKMSYKEEILRKTTLSEIADEQLKIIFQDRDYGAKNTAIKEVIDTVEGKVSEEGDQVLIVLK